MISLNRLLSFSALLLVSAPLCSSIRSYRLSRSYYVDENDLGDYASALSALDSSAAPQTGTGQIAALGCPYDPAPVPSLKWICTQKTQTGYVLRNTTPNPVYIDINGETCQKAINPGYMTLVCVDNEVEFSADNAPHQRSKSHQISLQMVSVPKVILPFFDGSKEDGPLVAWYPGRSDERRTGFNIILESVEEEQEVQAEGVDWKDANRPNGPDKKAEQEFEQSEKQTN